MTTSAELAQLEVSDDVRVLNPELFARAEQFVADAVKPSKMHNLKTEYAGVVWDSKKESERAFYLLNQQDRKAIFCLCYHVRFPLDDGEHYEADFVYLVPTKEGLAVVIEDVKPFDKRTNKFRLTTDFRRKRRLFQAKYKRFIEVV